MTYQYIPIWRDEKAGNPGRVFRERFRFQFFHFIISANKLKTNAELTM